MNEYVLCNMHASEGSVTYDSKEEKQSSILR